MANEIVQAELRRVLFRARFSTWLVDEYLRKNIQAFAKAFPQYLDGRELSTLTRKERRAFMAQVRLGFKTTWRETWTAITDQFQEFTAIESEFIAALYSNADAVLKIPAASAMFGAINAAEITLALGSGSAYSSTWHQLVSQNTNSTMRLIEGVIVSGMQEGLDNTEILEALRGTYHKGDKGFRGGLLGGVARNRAEALIRTGTNHFSSLARDLTMRQNSDIIKKRYLLATFDNRTTDICRSRHGMTWDIDDENYPRLPFHWNERSTWVFLFEGEDQPSGSRPAIGGRSNDPEDYDDRPRYTGRKDRDLYDVEEISAGTSMDKWLRRQPRAFIESSLGKKRAALFIDGGLPIHKFTDAHQRPLTLDGLRLAGQNDPAINEAFDLIGDNDG